VVTPALARPSDELVATARAGAAALRQRIADAGGDPDHVRIVAVTKGFPAEVPAAALAAGLDDLGESYAQELATKAGQLAGAVPAPRWHFIGRLQRNKVRLVAPHVHLWQSVDRVELGAEIARRAPGASVLVQVNPAGEAQKGGCVPEEAADLVAVLRDQGLDVRGLMAVAPAAGPEVVEPALRRVAVLADDLALPERSLGMSGDLEVAVRAGSTMVRVGTALFGDRPPR